MPLVQPRTKSSERLPQGSRSFCFSAGVALALALVLVAGSLVAQTPEASQPASRPVVASPPGASPADVVLASVDGTLITERDVRFAIFELRLYEPSLWNMPDESLVNTVLTTMVDEVLLYRHFWRADAKLDEAEIKSASRAAWSRYERLAGTRLKLESMMAESKLRESEIVKWLETRAERNATIDAGIGTKIDPALLNVAGETASRAERVWLAHVFVAPQVPGDPKSWEEARLRSMRIWTHIAEGFSFERAAAVFSDDESTRQQAGDLGWMESTSLSASVRESIGVLSIDDVTSPVLGTTGYHLFKLLDYQTPRRREVFQQATDLKNAALRRLREDSDMVLAPGMKLEPVPEPSKPAEPSLWDRVMEERRANMKAPQ